MHSGEMCLSFCCNVHHALTCVTEPATHVCCPHQTEIFQSQEAPDCFPHSPLFLTPGESSEFLTEIQECYQLALLVLIALWAGPVISIPGCLRKVSHGMQSESGTGAQAPQNSATARPPNCFLSPSASHKLTEDTPHGCRRETLALMV